MDAEPVAPADNSQVELAAFDYVPEWDSRIRGLGGQVSRQDPNYVFHTRYSEFGGAQVTVTIEFEGLEATAGMLIVRIGACPSRAGAVAYQMSAHEFPVWVLAKDGIPATVTFRPAADMLYAVMGHIFDDTDAVATGVRVSWRQAAEVAAEAAAVANERRTPFAARTIGSTAQLTATSTPRLVQPVSQMATAGQYAEPVYAEWRARLNGSDAPAPEQWRLVYTLQVLRCYGLLEPGARGVGFDPDTAELPAVLASMGCTVVLADRAAASTEPWRRPALCPDDAFDRRVSHQPVDVTDIPAALAAFDFLWSQPDLTVLGSVAAVTDFLLRSLACLKPGGLAVHVVPFAVPDPDGSAVEDGELAFVRGDFERLALSLIGRGHEIAQLNYDPGDHVGRNLFGLILRRGLHT